MLPDNNGVAFEADGELVVGIDVERAEIVRCTVVAVAVISVSENDIVGRWERRFWYLSRCEPPIISSTSSQRSLLGREGPDA